jgi:hypothetical protein
MGTEKAQDIRTDDVIYLVDAVNGRGYYMRNGAMECIDLKYLEKMQYGKFS